MATRTSASLANSRSSDAADTAILDLAIADYYEDLCNSVKRRGHSPALAREIVHDLYIKLRRPGALMNSTGPIKPFLLRACINLGIDRLRRARLEAALFSGTEEDARAVADPALAPDSHLDLRQRLALLKVAIMEMSAERRRVFIANRLGRLSRDEISRRMGISRNMVDRHLRKAILHCLDRLDPVL
jgi:RNA polymerase sigma factor (sigma-70 family)